jgi:hypothetical protein
VSADRDVAESPGGTPRRQSLARSLFISMLIGAVYGAFCAVCQCLWVGDFAWDHVYAIAIMRAAKSGFAIGVGMVLLLYLGFNVGEACLLATGPMVFVTMYDLHYLVLLVTTAGFGVGCRIVLPHASREGAASADGATSRGRQT